MKTIHLKALGILALLCYALNANAAFCPTNFKMINEGYTINQVIQACGKPAQQLTQAVPIEPPQEWNYYIGTNVSTTPIQQTQGTLKVTIAFNADGKAINISVNGLAVGGTGICKGGYLQLGNSRETVQKLCGIPNNINKETLSGQQSNQMTTLIYTTNPPKSLSFKDGVLQANPP